MVFNEIENAAAQIGFYINTKKTMYMSFNQDMVDNVTGRDGEMVKSVKGLQVLWCVDQL